MTKNDSVHKFEKNKKINMPIMSEPHAHLGTINLTHISLASFLWDATSNQGLYCLLAEFSIKI